MIEIITCAVNAINVLNVLSTYVAVTLLFQLQAKHTYVVQLLYSVQKRFANKYL